MLQHVGAGIGSNGRDLQSLKQQVLHCIASAQAKLNGDGPPKQNGHAHPGETFQFVGQLRSLHFDNMKCSYKPITRLSVGRLQ